MTKHTKAIEIQRCGHMIGAASIIGVRSFTRIFTVCLVSLCAFVAMMMLGYSQTSGTKSTARESRQAVDGLALLTVARERRVE